MWFNRHNSLNFKVHFFKWICSRVLNIRFIGYINQTLLSIPVYKLQRPLECSWMKVCDYEMKSCNCDPTAYGRWADVKASSSDRSVVGSDLDGCWSLQIARCAGDHVDGLSPSIYDQSCHLLNTRRPITYHCHLAAGVLVHLYFDVLVGQLGPGLHSAAERQWQKWQTLTFDLLTWNVTCQTQYIHSRINIFIKAELVFHSSIISHALQ